MSDGLALARVEKLRDHGRADHDPWGEVDWQEASDNLSLSRHSVPGLRVRKLAVGAAMPPGTSFGLILTAQYQPHASSVLRAMPTSRPETISRES